MPEERKLRLKIAFEPSHGNAVAFVLRSLEDGDSTSVPLELWNPSLHPFVDIDRAHSAFHGPDAQACANRGCGHTGKCILPSSSSAMTHPRTP
jgi:hypothetical protein